MRDRHIETRNRRILQKIRAVDNIADKEEQQKAGKQIDKHEHECIIEVEDSDGCRCGCRCG